MKMNTAEKKLLLMFAAYCLSSVPVASQDLPIVKELMMNDTVVAKTTRVRMNVNFKEHDFGSNKEFGLSIGHHYFHNFKVSEMKKGQVLDVDLIVPTRKSKVKLKLTELDEHHGPSIDAIIALPFSYFNPDDNYIDTNFTLGGSQVIAARFERDLVEFRISETQEITTAQLVDSMRANVSGCRLSKSSYNLAALRPANVAKCRNFKAGIYTLSKMGVSDGDLKDMIISFEPEARVEQVDYVIADIDWYERNFMK
jgi:hypothetical protein